MLFSQAHAHSNGGEEWRRGLPMLFLLALQFLLTIEGTERMVGGSWGWSIPKDANRDTIPDFSYQDWADQYTWLAGDILRFVYDPQDYGVIIFPSGSAFDSCDTDINMLENSKETRIMLTGSGDVYFGADSYFDCYDGMKFSLSFTNGSSSEPPPSSSSSPPDLNTGPPPPSSSRSLPQAPPGGLTQPSPPPSKKSSSAAVFVLVPILLLLAIGGGIGVWFLCKRRRQRLQFLEQAGLQAQHPAHYPNPPTVSLAGFTPQHQREQSFEGGGFVTLPKGSPYNNNNSQQ